MKHLRWTVIFLVGSLALFALGCPPEDDDDNDNDDQMDTTEYQVELAGENEVPPVASPATGTMDVTLDDDDILTIDGTFENLVSQLTVIEGSSAHIHVAGMDETGPIVFDVDVDANDDERSGSFTLTEQLSPDQVRIFENNEYYLNIHTNAYPGGELRAQLDEEAPEFAGIEQSWGVEMTPEAQPHEVDSDAEGWLWAILRDDETFVISGAMQNLSSDITNVFLKRANDGEMGPVIFTLDREERDDEGYRFFYETELSEEQLDDLREGLFYVNVVTEDLLDGELRGQLDENGNFFQNVWEDIFGDSPTEIDEAPPF